MHIKCLPLCFLAMFLEKGGEMPGLKGLLVLIFLVFFASLAYGDYNIFRVPVGSSE